MIYALYYFIFLLLLKLYAAFPKIKYKYFSSLPKSKPILMSSIMSSINEYFAVSLIRSITLYGTLWVIFQTIIGIILIIFNYSFYNTFHHIDKETGGHYNVLPAFKIITWGIILNFLLYKPLFGKKPVELWLQYKRFISYFLR
jgi:hypothetical protein